jgi:hypothetical protein
MDVGLSCPIRLTYQGKTALFPALKVLFADYAKTGQTREEGLREAANKA